MTLPSAEARESTTRSLSFLQRRHFMGPPRPATYPPGIVDRDAVARTDGGSGASYLLADAEAREDPVQDVLARARAGDLVQGGQRALQILGEELRARPCSLGRQTGRQTLARLAQRGLVAQRELAQGAGLARPPIEEAPERRAQLREAGPGPGADRQPALGRGGGARAVGLAPDAEARRGARR